MLSLGSGKCYRQCLRNRASPKGWSCCRRDQASPSAKTISYSTIEGFCPYFSHSHYLAPQELTIEDLNNHQWQREGVQNDHHTSDYPPLNHLTFETYPFYGNVQDLSENVERTPRARISGTSERIQQVVESIDFKAAAEKLYLVLTRADQFLNAFLGSFLQEMSIPYMDRTSAWKQKVAHYNRHLVWPVLEEDQNEQHERQTATRGQYEKADFPEYEQQIKKSIEILCHDKLILTSPIDAAYLERNAPRDDSNIELELPDAHYIDIEVRKELAEALVKNVRNVKPVLLRNVANMSADYQAARNALAAIKKLEEIFDVYKRCWDPEIRNVPDQRA